MRIALFIAAALTAAPAAAINSDFSTREGCLRSLSRALQNASNMPGAVRYFESQLANAPDAASEHVADAIDALHREKQASIDYADAVMLICQSYD